MYTKGIFIDDAGTPGVESKSVFLPEDRKSFCAVIIPECVYSDVEVAMQILLDGIKKDHGVQEVHCTEIYSGKGKWRKASIHQRIEIFDLLTLIFQKFQLPVVFQTASHLTYNDHPAFKQFERVADSWWDLKRVDHFALLYLCFEMNKMLVEMSETSPADFSLPFPLFIDEGLVKAGAEIRLPNWDNSFHGKKIVSVRSQDSFGIQLADFAAFCIARSQWLMAKADPGSRITEADRHILSISGKLNIWNGQKVSVNPESFSRDNFEWIMMRDRKKKNLKPKPHSVSHSRFCGANSKKEQPMNIAGHPKKKLGRNDICYCGSGVKYKKCCMKKN